MKKSLFVLLSVGFLFFGISAFIQSKPSNKNARIYTIVKAYSPYYLEKRFGGLRIRSKADKDFKEKPDNMELFHRFESLEKTWGQTHLQLENNTLIILDDQGIQQKNVPLKTEDETQFIHRYYGI